MLKQTTSILLLVILINYTCGQEKWFKNTGVANINCPLDDDPDDPTVLSYPGDCSKFIKCSYGLGYTLSCPRGLHWSISLSRCESRKVANCVSSGQNTNNPEIGGGGCTFTYKPNPNDCSKVIQCVNGIETELECPAGSLWDKRTNKCSFTDVVC